MKNLIRTFMIFILFAFGPQTHGQFKFGVKAGMNANNIAMNFADSDDEEATKMRLAYHIGVIADYGLSDVLSLQSGLVWSSKGFSYDLEDDLEEDESVEGYDRVILNYLEIPIQVAYKFNKFQVFAGPYVAFGMGGKNKWDYTYKWDGGEDADKGEDKFKAKFGEVSEDDLGEDEDAYNAFDYGLNFGAGYQVGPVLINAGYSLGLGNTTPDYGGDFDPKDYKVSNRVITLSVSYFFGK